MFASLHTTNLDNSLKNLIEDYKHTKKLYLKIKSDNNRSKKYQVLIKQRLLITLEQINDKITPQNQNIVFEQLNTTSIETEKNSLSVEIKHQFNATTHSFPEPELTTPQQNHEILATKGFKPPYRCYKLMPGSKKYLFSQKKVTLPHVYQPINVIHSLHSAPSDLENFKQWQEISATIFTDKNIAPSYMDPNEWEYMTPKQQAWESAVYGKDRYELVKLELEYSEMELTSSFLSLSEFWDKAIKNQALEFAWQNKLLPRERQLIREKVHPREINDVSAITTYAQRGLSIFESFEQIIDSKIETLKYCHPYKDDIWMSVSSFKNCFLNLENLMFNDINLDYVMAKNYFIALKKRHIKLLKTRFVAFSINEKKTINNVLEILEKAFLARFNYSNIEQVNQVINLRNELLELAKKLYAREEKLMKAFDNIESYAIQSKIDPKQLENLFNAFISACSESSHIIYFKCQYYITKLKEIFPSLVKNITTSTTPSSSANTPSSCDINRKKTTDYTSSVTPSSKNATMSDLNSSPSNLLIEALNTHIDIKGIDQDYLLKNLTFNSYYKRYKLSLSTDELAKKYYDALVTLDIECAFESGKILVGGLVNVKPKIQFLDPIEKILEQLERKNPSLDQGRLMVSM